MSKGDSRNNEKIQKKYPDAPGLINVGQDHARSESTRNELARMQRKHEE